MIVILVCIISSVIPLVGLMPIRLVIPLNTVHLIEWSRPSSANPNCSALVNYIDLAMSLQLSD